MNNIRRLGLKIATLIHKDQKRKDGKPYINHCVAVAENALGIYSKLYEHDIHSDVVYLIAIQHDAREDQDYEESKYVAQLEEAGFEYGQFVLDALTILNKNLYNNYLEYILAVKQNRFATIVKLADLKHNMSDLQEGSLKDKYRLAEYILEN